MEINRLKLSTLYDATEIQSLWQHSQNKKVINHPLYGWISPNEYRNKYTGKPCCYCGKKMLQGVKYKTTSKQQAKKRGYEYIDNQGNSTINQAGNFYYHPNYVTLDHKINKARCPEKLFDYDNLEVICWSCNHNKRDDNTYELKHNLSYIKNLSKLARERHSSE